MCSAKGDDVNSSTESSRTSSYSSDDDSSVESVSNSHLIPPPSFAEDTTSFVPLGPYTRTTRRRKVALVASLLAVAIAVGAGWSGSCWAGLCGADDGRSGARQRAELKTDRDVATLRQEEKCHIWQRPIRHVLRKLREGQDDRRERRKFELKAEDSSDVPGEHFGKSRKNDRKTEKRRKPGSGHRGSRGGVEGEGEAGRGGRLRGERESAQMFPAALMPRARKPWTEERENTNDVENDRRKNGRTVANKRKAGLKTGTREEDRTKRKRRALQALWRRVTEKLGGGTGGGNWRKRGRKAGGDGEAEQWKAVMLADLREKLEEQHGGTLWARAKAVRHELEDGLLLRYLEMAYWTMETMGQSLPDAVANTIRWREGAGPHLVTDQQVAEEAMYGKMYVRGHDREGRPIIHYRPGLEKSFDTEKGLNLLFYTLERAKTMLPEGQTQFAVLADCSGFGPSKTPPLPMLKTAFITMQRHYPMRLGYVMIANAGGPIAFVWKIISAVLDDRTKDKISFLSKKEAEAKLTGLISPSALPAALPGGLDDFNYSNEEYLSLP